jgi:hypothetical protein
MGSLENLSKSPIICVPHRSIRAKQASSTNQCEYRKSKTVHVYSCFALLCVVLAVMCLCVIKKSLSLGL